jgi:signal transduction histidine kinase
MTEEHMKPLFKAYYRVPTSESRTMNPLGAGLGLKISKDIAKMLFGDITYSSEMGIGSCFTFSLNLECASADMVVKRKKTEIVAPDMIRVEF